MEDKNLKAILCLGLLLVLLPLVVNLANAQIDKIYEFNHSVPQAILEKINSYVINKSGISEEYFYDHFSIERAVRIPYSCSTSPEEFLATLPEPKKAALCFAIYPDINYSRQYAVKISYLFQIDGYEGVVRPYGFGLEGNYYIFIIKNDEVVGEWKSDFLKEGPFPKIPEVFNTIPKKELELRKESCFEKIRFESISITKYPKELSSSELIPNELELVYYGYGTRNSKTYQLFVNLETGQYLCKEASLIEKQGRGIIFPQYIKIAKFVFFLLLSIGLVMIVISVILFVLSKTENLSKLRIPATIMVIIGIILICLAFFIINNPKILA